MKTRTSKNRKIDIFPKGLTHGLGQKMAIFTTVFLGNIPDENVFHDILERKNAFRGYKNKRFKKLKNCYFSKRVNPWFSSINGYFSNFFFQSIQARKMSFTIFQDGKTPFQAKKAKTSKSRKIDIFQQGLTLAFDPKMAIFPSLFFQAIQARKTFLRYSRKKKRLSRL